MPTRSISVRPAYRSKAVVLVMLMVLLPLGPIASSPDQTIILSESAHPEEVSPRTWGENGSNDTGWMDFEAIGSDSANGTPAYADLMLEFAPGAVISNLTIEIAVNGSDGYWVNQPQIAIMNTQTEILDWSGQGDLGRQNDFTNNPPTLTGGILDTSLKPNTVSDASWQVPTGIEITDLVIEALRPVDPKLSFNPLNVTIHDSAYNPIDGRMYLLVDDDLLHLDDNANKRIIDITNGVSGRSLAVDANRDILYVGNNEGNVSATRLSDSSVLGEFQTDVNQTNSDPILSLAVDVFGVVWAATECGLHYLSPAKDSTWTSVDFCLGPELETPVNILVEGRHLFLATEGNGIHSIYYNVSGTDSSVIVIDKNTLWDSSNFLSGDSISDIDMANGILYVATSDSGIDRFDTTSSTWLSSWSSGNWLVSDSVSGLAVTPGWLYILSDDAVQVYDTSILLFRSEISLMDMGLSGQGSTISGWPSGPDRAPSDSLALVGDGSGRLGRILGENTDGYMAVVSSPSIQDAQVTAIIDDGEAGEFWISSGSVIDMMDRRDTIWKTPIDLSDHVSDPGSVTGIIQDHSGWVWVGTTGSGVHRLSASNSGSYFGSIQGLSSSHVTSMAYDDSSGILVVGHLDTGVSLFSTGSHQVVETFSTSNGLDSDSVRDIASRYGVAYIATGDQGVMRIDLSTLSIIGSWQSLGVDNLENTPLAVDGGTIYLGLTGLGVLVIDRLTSDIIDLWTPDDPNSIPDADVNTLAIDYYGGLLVGSEVQNTGASGNGGLARWDGSSWELLETSIPGWNNDPFEFYDVSSDANGIYAGTNRGACMWNWAANTPQSSIELEDCWTSGGGGGGGGGGQGDGMPSRFVISVDPIGSDLLYAGTTEGAAVINTANGTVIDVWTAGDDTERARIAKVGDIVYLGFENVGIARYNLTSGDWLPAWDGSQGIISDDDVTVLISGRQQGTLWAGGDFGLTLIDAQNETALIQWNRGNNPNGPTLPNTSPAELLIADHVMYYSPQRAAPWNERDEITRINLDNNSTLLTIDAGDRLGYDGVIHGMNQIGEEIWISVVETAGWQGGDLGTIVRWNATSNDWADDLQTIGDVGRVNARYLGDCFPMNTSCELWVAYGDNILRRFSASSMTLLDQWEDVDGRIRGMVEYQGEYLFASMNGILRWNPANESWLPSWLPDDGLPTEAELDFYSMTVVGDDLWASSGYGNDAHVLRLSGNNSNWTVWDFDTPDIPDGYGADIILCNDIVHIATGFTAWQWWVSGGGVARFDLADNDGDGNTEQWLPPLTQDNSNIADRDVRALACDEANDILYVGFDTEDVGIDRFNYNSNNFLPTLTPDRGVSAEKVFPGGMLHDGNVLMAAHYDGSGGITRVITSGTSASSGQVIGTGMDACSIVRAPSQGSNVYAIGRSGDSSGINRVDRLDATGLIEGGFDELVGLPSGIVHEMISNGTHVWVTVGSSVDSFYGSTILQGELLGNGSVNWQYGYDAIYENINEIMLQDGEIWASVVGGGLWSVNLSQRAFHPTPPSLHNQMDGLLMDDGQMYVGLMGYLGSSAGFQMFDPSSRTWGPGSLIAGLPSNIVTDFVQYGDRILVGTHGGIGLWNLTRSDWDDPITTVDGLPSPIINHLFVPPSQVMGNGTLLTGGPTGMHVLDHNMSYVGSIGRAQGLVGDAVAGIVYAGPVSRIVNDTATGTTTTIFHDAALFISHNGQGSTRPGVTAWDLDKDMENGTYNIDMIPSNDVRAVAADNWGVHIATSSQPLVHWNGSSMSMESGPGALALQGWPILDLTSDGTHLAVISPSRVSIVKATGDHEIVIVGDMPGAIGANAAHGRLAVLGEDGLHVYQPMETLREVPRETQRRAEPLNAIFVDRTIDITDTSHPGMDSVLVDMESKVNIPLDDNQANSSDLLVYPGVITFSAPQGGAWIWAKSSWLNYSGSWDLASFDSGIQASFQSAIFNTQPGSSSSVVHLQMQSPQDGKIKIRMTYDWERLEAPTEITSLYDRPNDGGGVLLASWVPAQDSAWSAYRVYVWDSTSDPDWAPMKEDLQDFPSYQRIPYWSQTTTLFTMGNINNPVNNISWSEVPLSPDRQYRAAIAIEYPDGTLGEPSSWQGNATPTDEVPPPPEWLTVEPISGGNPGTLNAEWSACQELDPHLTRIWAVQQEISSALALTNPMDFAFAAGNSTVLDLEGNVPYWFAIACVDEAGQFDAANATVVGPVVTAGGLNDGIPPLPITGTTATDAPQDEGGRVLVTWDPNEEEDCSYHVIYVLPASGFTAPTTVDGWPEAAFVPDCTTGESFVDTIGNSTLEDGIVYWFGVVAVDDWGNADVDNVLVVEATSYSEMDDAGGIPPYPVEGLQAWDHPDDDGTAIDVKWNRSTADDFSHYTVWASNYPLDNLAEVFFYCDSTDQCDLVTIDQRQIGNDPQLEITLTSALYGTEPNNLVSSPISPLIPLYVTVTIHDISGNVQLTGLGERVALVTPMDNRGDLFPPDRIGAPTLEDRSPDSGDAFYVEFEASGSDDIGEYWVFAVTGSPFDSVVGMEPAMVMERGEGARALLEQVSGGGAIVPDVPVWVAVVSIDTSGNAWLDNIETSFISPVDEDSQDPGTHLPEVSGIVAYWNPENSMIELLWEGSDAPEVLSYQVFASTMEFTDTRDAILVASEVTSSNASFESIGPTPVSASDSYWIAVVAFDGEVHRLGVDSLRVKPLSEFSVGDGTPGQSPGMDSWYDQLVSGELNMFIAIISALMILFGAALIIKPKDRSAPQPWEMGTLEVEREEELNREAMGISEEDEISSSSALNPQDSDEGTPEKPSSEDPEEWWEDSPEERPVPDASVGELLESGPEEVGLEDLNVLADELDDEEEEDEGIDTTFLDEALE